MRTIESVLLKESFLQLSRFQPALFDDKHRFTLQNGTVVTVYAPGVIGFCPLDMGQKDIVLSSGIHGNETAPIEICQGFVTAILSGEMHIAHRVLFIFGNLSAMNLGERFVEENMNRLFCGHHSNPPGLVNDERKRAKLLEQVMTEFYNDIALESQPRVRLHYDLHTAIRRSKNEKFAVYPFLHGKTHCKEQLMFMHVCGVNTVLLSASPTTTFSYFSSRLLATHSFTVELGQVKPFGQNDMSRFSQAKQALQRLLTEQEVVLPNFSPDKLMLYRVNQVIHKTKEDFRLNFSDDQPNFTEYAKGCVLAEESGNQYVAEQDGEAIVFPNANVAIGQRALLTVVPTSI